MMIMCQEVLKMREAFQKPGGSCTLARIHQKGMEFVGIPVALPTDTLRAPLRTLLPNLGTHQS